MVEALLQADRYAPDKSTGTTTPLQALLSTAAAAKVLCCGVRTVQKLVACGDLVAVKIGRAVRFDGSDLAAFIEAHKSPTRSCAENAQ